MTFRPAIGEALIVPGEAGAYEDIIVRDGVAGRSAKDRNILNLLEGQPWAYFDYGHMLEKARTAKSLFGATMILSFVSNAGITIAANAEFNGEMALTLATPGKAIRMPIALPESYSYIGGRILTTAEKAGFAAGAQTRAFFYGWTGAANTYRFFMASTALGASRYLAFHSAAGDENLINWVGSSPNALAEPTADVLGLWGIRFDATSKESSIYYQDPETSLKDFTHAASTPYVEDASHVTYVASVNPSNDTNGWKGPMQFDLFIRDDGPNGRVSDQRWADMWGDLQGALTP